MKRTQTVKVKLDGDAYHDWGAVIYCCGKRKMFNKDDFEPSFMWHCNDCGKMLIAIDSDGIPYYVGPPIFDRKRK